MSAIGRRLDKVERGLFPQQQTAAIGQFVERGAEEVRYRQLLGKLASGVLTDEESDDLHLIQTFALSRMKEAGFRLHEPTFVGTPEQRRAAVAAAAMTHEEVLAELD